MSKIFCLCLYHTSFAPLWISIIFIDVKNIVEHESNLMTEKISLGCVIISVVLSICIMNSQMSRKEGNFSYKLVEASEEKNIVAEYLLSYILPLFAFDFTHWDQVVLFLIFYLTLGFLCIRHNYFGANIILELEKYKLYKCKIKNEDKIQTEQLIISRQNLTMCIGDEIKLKSINNEYKLDVGN